MTMIVFNQNPMIAKLLESVSKKLELPMEHFNHYEELSVRLKKDPEWLLIADDESLEKLDQVDWLELKEIISQNHLNLCMYKKGNEAQPFLEGFEVKMKKPFLPTEVLKILQKKLGFNASEPEASQSLEPVKETLEANWDALEDLGDLESLAKEEPNAEEQLLPTLDAQKENEEVKEEEKQEVAETPQEKEKSQDDETQENAETQEITETPQETEASQELENLQVQKLETQEITETPQEKEKSQDSPSAQELEAMQELVKEIQKNSNEDKKENQEITETPQETQETETQEIAEIPQETETQEVTEQKENQEITETPQEAETKTQDQETPQETQDNYETIEDIPEPVMAKAMGEALPLVNEALIETSNNENAAQTPKESVTETPQENAKIPQKSDATSSPLELRLNLQDLLKSLNQESLKSLLENKTLSIKITLEDKNPHA
ncbi:hypothetical protein HPSA50_1550 [Helicobacter pylori SouthAfrica50]|uniref:Poly E-rich protein n=1 Tax=Helicobacter pylori SouthAfrica50 TaxID=1352357 RepID=T2S948_HELPX|nr:hypothetical protein HPSA50_1550 [Helicobacter pylori SouthAfrica50]